MICQKCGAQNIDGVTFCGSCGAVIESPIPQSPETPRQGYTQPGYQQAQSPQPPYYSQINPQMGGASSGGMVMPKNYLVESIVVTIVATLCCCGFPVSTILGIIAIVKANDVNTKFSQGLHDEAIQDSIAAKKLTIWAAAVAVVLTIIGVVLYFAFFAAIYNAAGGWEEFIQAIQEL